MNISDILTNYTEIAVRKEFLSLTQEEKNNFIEPILTNLLTLQDIDIDSLDLFLADNLDRNQLLKLIIKPGYNDFLSKCDRLFLVTGGKEVAKHFPPVKLIESAGESLGYDGFYQNTDFHAGTKYIFKYHTGDEIPIVISVSEREIMIKTKFGLGLIKKDSYLQLAEAIKNTIEEYNQSFNSFRLLLVTGDWNVDYLSGKKRG